LRLCQPRGIPILFTNHTRYDLYAQAYMPGVGELVGEAALRAYLPPFCRACDLVVAPSPGMCEVLKRFGVDAPIEVIPNGVDLEPFRQPIEPLEREAFGFQREDVILLYVGRLGPEKNLPFLLRAVAGTAQAYRNVRLLLVGGGPEADNLKDRVQHMGIQEYVTFVGSVDYDQVPRYMSMADVFVTASLTEVHPLSVIEAMAAGKPVMGMISPGVGDTVEDWQTGFLAEPDDLAGFTAKLVRLVVNPQERHEMGARARQASEQYAIERTTQMISERYRRLVEAAAGRKRRWRARMLRWWDGFR
jgi:glycosyltransferase involved in cell wall biosynthesis